MTPKLKSMGMSVSLVDRTPETTPASLAPTKRQSFGTVPFEVVNYDRALGSFSYRFLFPPMRLQSGSKHTPSKAR